MSVIQSNEEWAEEVFSECNLGDKRRTRRLIKVASDMAGKVGKSLSMVCEGNDAALEGGYRLIRNEAVKASDIGEGGYVATARKVKERELLLALEDTTSVSYYHDVIDDLGDIGGSSGKEIGHKRGFLVHSILMVDAQRKETLGLIEQNFWIRDVETRGKKHERNKRAYEEKESFKWEFASEKMACRLARNMDKVISVCDREADIYDYISYKYLKKQRFIIRAGQNRKLAELDENLASAFNTAPKLGTYDLFISQRSGRKARTTKIDLYSCKVSIRSPKGTTEEPLCLNMVVAMESTPEESHSSISWVILTTEVVNTFEEAKEVISYYAMRWRIEEFHKAWKTGAGAERQRMQSADNLERMLVILSFVAVRLFQLREALENGYENNNDVENIPCTTVLTEEEYKVLWFANQRKGEKKKSLPKKVPNLEWAYREIAKLGGWCNSKKTGRASWLTVWHGWFRLQDRLEGYWAAQM